MGISLLYNNKHKFNNTFELKKIPPILHLMVIQINMYIYIYCYWLFSGILAAILNFFRIKNMSLKNLFFLLGGSAWLRNAYAIVESLIFPASCGYDTLAISGNVDSHIGILQIIHISPKWIRMNHKICYLRRLPEVKCIV